MEYKREGSRSIQIVSFNSEFEENSKMEVMVEEAASEHNEHLIWCIKCVYIIFQYFNYLH